MNYQEAWAFLDNLQFFKIKLGLDSMAHFLDKVDNPQNKVKSVHVAGTNGKGSMSVTLLSILAQAGYKVGLYTSPHLSSVRERFRINDHFIPEDDFALIASEIRDILQGRQITYFEFTTTLAMLWFAREEVDLAILEVGMGGRLDATNVVKPCVSVITNVSMDHEAYLGNTLSAVATEKAGIVKPGVPVVSGVANDASRDVVEESCRRQGAPFFLLGRDFSAGKEDDRTWSFSGLKPDSRLDHLPASLRGRYQIDNMALALATVELLGKGGYLVDEGNIRKGLQSVRWPGRLEYFRSSSKQYLLDGAHNPAGVASLVDALNDEFEYRDLVLVWASMADKDIASGLAAVSPLCRDIVFTRPEGERSALPEHLAGFLPEDSRARTILTASVEEALRKAEDVAGPEDLICVAGSLYLIGAARKLLLGELAGKK